jgi:hypothetical protein
MGKTFRRHDEDDYDYQHGSKKQRKIARIQENRRMIEKFYRDPLTDLEDIEKKRAS